MLHAHDLLPHFAVADLEGERFRYSSIWQRKNLVLVLLPDSNPPSRHYAGQLMARAEELGDEDTEWLVTPDPIEGLPRPGVVVADRWGEIAYVSGPSEVGELPVLDELLEWMHHVQHRCPECEGEAK
jgi:hypothetical protein